MPRSARIILPNLPHHIVQRGHNRQPVFLAADDYSYYLENLLYFKEKLGCTIYAYCLMTNHVHLVVDPGDDPQALSLLMKGVAGRHTRRINKLERRSGSSWEGRFKSSLVATDDYLPACCRYIELNPLRAGLVSDPLEYRWSSFRAKVLGEDAGLVDLPEFYLALGDDEKSRRAAYREYVVGTIPEEETRLIREALQRGQLTGGTGFHQEIEARLGMRVSNRRPGRPKKKQ